MIKFLFLKSKKMSVIAEPLFKRSLAFAQKWLAELSPVVAAAPVAPVVVAQAASATATPAVAEVAKKAKPAAAAAAPADATSMSKVALLCGKVLEVKEHPESEHLFVEQIDLGEEKPRTIISGLRGHVTAEEFTGRNVVVVANLEPRKMRGILSEGMVLCACSEGKSAVKLLRVPDGVQPGERITFPGHAGPAEPVLKKKLVKHWEDVAPELKTDSACVATYKGLPFTTSQGNVTCEGLAEAAIS